MQAQTRPRREHVPGRRGIYYRLDSKGRRVPGVFEITFHDSQGARRWQTVAGSVEEAEVERANIVGRKARGERVSPAARATLDEVVAEWFAQVGGLRPRTRASYATNLRLHVSPTLGRRRVAEVDADEVARLVRELEAEGLAPWTIRSVLSALSRVFGYAVRRGMVSANPVAKLDRGERPRIERRELPILTREEVAALLAAAISDRYRLMLAVSILTGLRQGELLGLKWGDLDLGAGTLFVRRQLDRSGRFAPPKTPQAVRAVDLAPSLVAVLAAYRLGLDPALSSDAALVFATATGKPLSWRNVTRSALGLAIERSGIEPLRWHDMRHAFASILIAQGLDVVYVSRQLGHASPAITL
jgi:integrase